jgi:hypothetical protein
VLPNAAQHRQPVDPWQHPIQNDQRRPLGGVERKCGGAISSVNCAVALGLQLAQNHARQVERILN